jgi:hypothetical protein
MSGYLGLLDLLFESLLLLLGFVRGDLGPRIVKHYVD